MNFLNKARRKMEEAIDEIEASASRLSLQPRYPPPPTGYPYQQQQQQQPGYYVPVHQGPQVHQGPPQGYQTYPQAPAHVPQQWPPQPPQQYHGPPAPPSNSGLPNRNVSPAQPYSPYATPQWQQPQQYFPPPPPQQQQYHSPSPSQVTPQVQSPSPSQLVPQFHSPSPSQVTPQFHSPSPSQPVPQFHSPSPPQPAPQFHSPSLSQTGPQINSPSPSQVTPQFHSPSPSQATPQFHSPAPSHQSQQIYSPPPPYEEVQSHPPASNQPQQHYSPSPNQQYASHQQTSAVTPPPNQPTGSQATMTYPSAVELPACDPLNMVQELAGSEVPIPGQPSRAPSQAPSVPPQQQQQQQQQRTAPPATTAVPPTPVVNLPCLSTEGRRTTAVKFHVPKTGEDFSACEDCYRVYLAPYPALATSFAPYAGPESVFTCDLSFGRVREIVLKQCVPMHNIDPIREFVKILPTLTPCSGEVISSSGPMWITRDQVIPDLAVCSTCFELYLRLTPFETRFESIVYPETRDWSCDLAMPYFSRLLTSELVKSPATFETFAEEANARFNLPACTGYGKPIPIFEPLNKVVLLMAKEKSGRVCLACYSDILELTKLEGDWVPAQLSDEEAGKVSCDLAGSYSKLAMQVAINRRDTDLWRTAVGLDGKLSPCHGQKGIDEADLEGKDEILQWYQCIESPNVMACSRCYWLLIWLFGANHLFSPMRGALTPGTIRQCSWIHCNTPDEASIDSADNFENSSTWRGRRLRTAAQYGYETGNWSQLQTTAASIAKEPPPCAGNTRGFKRGSGRKWYGRVRANVADNNDATIVMCEECFVRTVKGRPHEALFNADLTEQAYRDEGTGGFMCQPYSNRARGYVRAAASSGDLGTFAQYWNNRQALAARRAQWEPILLQQNLKMAMYNHQTSLQMMMKGNAMANALSRIGSAGIVEAVSSDTGERWGNSQIGTNFMTKGRAEAEQTWVDAQNMKVGAGPGGGPTAETVRLLALWEIDNQAFLAVE